jgi:hypothetical protein
MNWAFRRALDGGVVFLDVGGSEFEGVETSSEDVPSSELWPCIAFGDALLPLSQYCASSSLDLGGVLEGTCFRALAAWIGITSLGRGGLEGCGPRGFAGVGGGLRSVGDPTGMLYSDVGLSSVLLRSLCIVRGPDVAKGREDRPGGCDGNCFSSIS